MLSRFFRRRLLLLTTVLLCLCSLSACSLFDVASVGEDSPDTSTASESNSDTLDRPLGYYDAVYIGDGFLAAGSNGRLDHIGTDGTVSQIDISTEQNLFCLYAEDGAPVVLGGANGTVLYSGDGLSFTEGGIDTHDDIFDVTRFKGVYYAALEQGQLYSSADGTSWQPVGLDTELSGDIISVDANDELIIAITAESDILISVDGTSWQHQNFNENYEEFYEPYIFSGIQNMGSTFFIYGQSAEMPEAPFVMFSSMADVWIFKPFSEINGQAHTEYFPLTINDIGYCGDQIVAACDDGRLLTITECSVCHQMMELDNQKLYAVATGGGMLLAAGEDFLFNLMEEDEVRQDQIEAEQAYIDFQNGAIIVDVRTDEEYAEGHITGCLHIPVDEVAEQLPLLVPDFESQIIFYCKAGTRSQQALETALELGYTNVYNLGAYDSWPYETETGPG